MTRALPVLHTRIDHNAVAVDHPSVVETEPFLGKIAKSML
jgi:hypothetical protein